MAIRFVRRRPKRITARRVQFIIIFLLFAHDVAAKITFLSRQGQGMLPLVRKQRQFVTLHMHRPVGLVVLSRFACIRGGAVDSDDDALHDLSSYDSEEEEYEIDDATDDYSAEVTESELVTEEYPKNLMKEAGGWKLEDYEDDAHKDEDSNTDDTTDQEFGFSIGDIDVDDKLQNGTVTDYSGLEEEIEMKDGTMDTTITVEEDEEATEEEPPAPVFSDTSDNIANSDILVVHSDMATPGEQVDEEEVPCDNLDNETSLDYVSSIEKNPSQEDEATRILPTNSEAPGLYSAASKPAMSDTDDHSDGDNTPTSSTLPEGGASADEEDQISQQAQEHSEVQPIPSPPAMEDDESCIDRMDLADAYDDADTSTGVPPFPVATATDRSGDGGQTLGDNKHDSDATEDEAADDDESDEEDMIIEKIIVSQVPHDDVSVSKENGRTFGDRMHVWFENIRDAANRGKRITIPLFTCGLIVLGLVAKSGVVGDQSRPVEDIGNKDALPGSSLSSPPQKSSRVHDEIMGTQRVDDYQMSRQSSTLAPSSTTPTSTSTPMSKSTSASTSASTTTSLPERSKKTTQGAENTDVVEDSIGQRISAPAEAQSPTEIDDIESSNDESEEKIDRDLIPRRAPTRAYVESRDLDETWLDKLITSFLEKIGNLFRRRPR